jgi:hypothetical protein
MELEVHKQNASLMKEIKESLGTAFAFRLLLLLLALLVFLGGGNRIRFQECYLSSVDVTVAARGGFLLARSSTTFLRFLRRLLLLLMLLLMVVLVLVMIVIQLTEVAQFRPRSAQRPDYSIEGSIRSEHEEVDKDGSTF